MKDKEGKEAVRAFSTPEGSSVNLVLGNFVFRTALTIVVINSCECGDRGRRKRSSKGAVGQDRVLRGKVLAHILLDLRLDDLVSARNLAGHNRSGFFMNGGLSGGRGDGRQGRNFEGVRHLRGEVIENQKVSPVMMTYRREEGKRG